MSAIRGPVQRTASLYTKGDQAVRVEVQMISGGLRLVSYGPGDAYRAVDFPDAKSLEDYHVTYERELLATGFHLQAVAERRTRGERATPRGGADRRRRC